MTGYVKEQQVQRVLEQSVQQSKDSLVKQQQQKSLRQLRKQLETPAQQSLMLGQLPDHPRLLVQRGISYEQSDRWLTSAAQQR